MATRVRKKARPRKKPSELKKIQNPYIPEEWHAMIREAAIVQDRSINSWLRVAIFNALKSDGFNPEPLAR